MFIHIGSPKLRNIYLSGLGAFIALFLLYRCQEWPRAVSSGSNAHQEDVHAPLNPLQRAIVASPMDKDDTSWFQKIADEKTASVAWKPFIYHPDGDSSHDPNATLHIPAHKGHEVSSHALTVTITAN